MAKEVDISKFSYRKIGKLIGHSHPQLIKYHLSKLIKGQYLDKNRHLSNLSSIKLNNLLKPSFVVIPVYGSANCGTATFIAQNKVEDYIKVSKSLLIKKNVIAIRAVGNSMNRANVNGQNIEDGDLVLVDINNKTPKNNDYVLSIIDNCANIKKFIKINKQQIALISESTEKFDPIYISAEENYIIVGVITQVLKKIKN